MPVKQPKAKIRDVSTWFALTDLPIEVTHWLDEKLARSKPEVLALSATFPSKKSEKKADRHTSFIRLYANGEGIVRFGENAKEENITVKEAWAQVRNSLWALGFGDDPRKK